ncbi:MAG: J domain-containing protein, partial [Desulfatiglandales bacterium]
EKLLPVARSLGLTAGSTNQLDYYAIVGVMPDASSEEIQKAYRKKAYEVHPDTSDSDKEDSQAFLRLHAAYQTLLDASLREQYDRSRQHRGIWYEDSPLNEVDPSIEKGRRDKTRHLYHLGAIVLVLIIAAFVFNSLYKHNSITDGFYSLRDHDTPGIQGKQPVPAGKSETQNVGVVKDGGTNQHTERPAYKVSEKPDLFARRIEVPTSGENHVVKRAPNQKVKPVVHKIEPYVFPEDTMTFHDEPQGVKPAKEKMQPVKPQKKQPARTVKSTHTPSEHTPSSSMTATADSEKKGDLPAAGESFLQSHGIPADYTPPPAYTAKEKKPIPIHDDKQQENIAFLASIYQDREGDEKQNPITQGDETIDDPSPTKNGGSTKVSRLEATISQVKDFIQVYMNTYESKNISQFSALFDPDATENGKPFRDEIPNYRRNFQRVQAVTITIDMYKFNIRYASNMITTKGTFSLKWQAKGGNWHEKKGEISMGLIESGTSYLIKDLNYQYRPNQG